MINIEGLRIGNYILGPDSTSPERFTIDWFHAIEINAITEEELTPISLSPEILEKCGFEATNGIEIKNYIWLVIHCDSGEANIYNIYKNETLQLRIECKYLHQLQNLYFALTGEELVFNYATEPVLPS